MGGVVVVEGASLVLESSVWLGGLTGGVVSMLVGVALGGLTVKVSSGPGALEGLLVGLSTGSVSVGLVVVVSSGKMNGSVAGRVPVVSTFSSYPTTRELGKLPSVESSSISGRGVVAGSVTLWDV